MFSFSVPIPSFFGEKKKETRNHVYIDTAQTVNRKSNACEEKIKGELNTGFVSELRK